MRASELKNFEIQMRKFQNKQYPNGKMEKEAKPRRENREKSVTPME